MDAPTTLVEKGFDALARIRSAPAFHPRGRLYEAVLEVEGRGPVPTGERPALVRLSKGAGLPGPAPDFLGVAVRVDPLHPAPVDFLCTTTVSASGFGRWLIAPARRWAGARFTSLMPWESGKQRRQVLLHFDDERLRGATPDEPAEHLPVEISVRVVDEHGRSVQEGRLTLTGVSSREREQVAFDPLVHHPHGWVLGPRWVARLREAAYVGSREGRRAHDPSTPD
jgi:hypothetical protein